MKNAILGVLGGLIIGGVLGYALAPGGFSGGTPGYMMRGYGMTENVDRHFIEQMIPHHEGAIAMAQLALTHSARPEIRSLAAGIVEAQERENETMRAWYQEWYGSTPRTGGMHGGNMHMGSMEGDLTALAAASDFDQEFLRQMIPHHEMAVMMAQMLAAGSSRPEMLELADQIITSQTREIDMMRSWAAAWSDSASATGDDSAVSGVE